MPWKIEDAERHTKLANNHDRRAFWVGVANHAKDNGKPDSDAIKIANAALRDYVSGRKKKRFWGN